MRQEFLPYPLLKERILRLVRLLLKLDRQADGVAAGARAVQAEGAYRRGTKPLPKCFRR